jgi:hypothetical protein
MWKSATGGRAGVVRHMLGDLKVLPARDLCPPGWPSTTDRAWRSPPRVHHTFRGRDAHELAHGTIREPVSQGGTGRDIETTELLLRHTTVDLRLRMVFWRAGPNVPWWWGEGARCLPVRGRSAGGTRLGGWGGGRRRPAATPAAATSACRRRPAVTAACVRPFCGSGR